jgi:hypothetical protein
MFDQQMQERSSRGKRPEKSMLVAFTFYITLIICVLISIYLAAVGP